MNRIKTYQEEIVTYINEYPYSKYPQELYDPIDYILSLGGKRMRPVLTLMGCELFNGDIRQAIPAAMAVETFHNFSLIHDDIMDNAPIRRGKPTVHEKWNVNTAILSGDVMLVEAYKLFMGYGDQLLRPLLESFNRTAVEVCEGQQIDMLFEHRDQVGVGEYIHMICLKTAVLLGASLEMGAIIAGADKKQADLLYEFGKNIGIAFQLRDDYLDLYAADPDKFGKQVGGDVIANKKTFMLIKAMELAGTEEQAKLMFWLKAKVFKAEEKVAAVKELYDRLGIPELINKETSKYADLAFQALSAIEGNHDQKEFIRTFTEDLLVREV